jgi:hypothetical protein
MGEPCATNSVGILTSLEVGLWVGAGALDGAGDSPLRQPGNALKAAPNANVFKASRRSMILTV